MSFILEAVGVDKYFGSVVAARGVNVAMKPGEIVAVIGANGAGKTTFINMVTGYLKPTSGAISIFGRSIVGMHPREIIRMGVGRSFQIPQVFQSMTALENIGIAIALHEEKGMPIFRPALTQARSKRAVDLLNEFGVEGYRDSLAQHLPQGVRKLLDIAMAIVHRPQLLLLDEPTSGVSAEEKFFVMDTIISVLRAQGVGVLFVEHDMEIMSRYVDRAIAFYAGHIIADGPPSEVLANALVQEKITGISAAQADTVRHAG